MALRAIVLILVMAASALAISPNAKVCQKEVASASSISVAASDGPGTCTFTAGNTLVLLWQGKGGGGGPNGFQLSNGTECTVNTFRTTGNVRQGSANCNSIPSGITSVGSTYFGSNSESQLIVMEFPAAELPSTTFEGMSTMKSTGLPATWTTNNLTTTNAYTVLYDMGFVDKGGGGGTALAPDTGWTLIGNAGTTNCNCAAFYKIVTSTGTYAGSGTGGPDGYTVYSSLVSYIYIPADYSITAPSPASAYYNNASASGTVTNATGISGTGHSITISDGGNATTVSASGDCPTASGSTPFTMALNASWTTCNFTLTPTTTGTLTFTFSMNGGSNPSPATFSFTANKWTFSVSGCASGNWNAASATCTATLGCGGGTCTFNGSITATGSDQGQGGTFSNGGSATPSNGASSFTYTYTPIYVGAKLITWTPSVSYIATASSAYTVNAVDASTFTCTNATCTFGSAANWTCDVCGSHTTPRTGDKIVSSGGTIVVPTGTHSIGTCPANNTNTDILLAPDGGNTGSLRIQSGGTLRVCGNVKLNASAVANPSTFADLQLDTGGTLTFDQNQSASVRYRVFPGTTGGVESALIRHGW